MRISLRYFTCLMLLVVLTLTFVWGRSTNIEHNVASTKQQTRDCRVVEHVMGETCIPNNPQRVVTLWISTLRTTLALSIKPVASTYIPGEPFPAHLKGQIDDVEYIGTLAEPNLEKILQLKPDLILANTRLQNIYQLLSDMAPTVVLKLPSPPLPWQQHLEDVAKILDKEKVSEQLVDEYWRRIEKLKLALGTRRSLQVSVATISPPYGIFIYGQQHPVSAVLNDIGLQRPLSQRGDFFTIDNISQERLSDIDGDVIFLSYRGGKAAKEVLEKLQQKPLWRQLKAVQQNQVYIVDAAHWYGFDVLAMNAVIDDLFKYLVAP